MPLYRLFSWPRVRFTVRVMWNEFCRGVTWDGPRRYYRVLYFPKTQKGSSGWRIDRSFHPSTSC